MAMHLKNKNRRNVEKKFNLVDVFYGSLLLQSMRIIIVVVIILFILSLFLPRETFIYADLESEKFKLEDGYLTRFRGQSNNGRVNDFETVIFMISPGDIFYIDGEEDMNNLLNARSFRYQNDNTWIRDTNEKQFVLKISPELFEDGRLKYLRPQEWKDDYVTMSVIEKNTGNDDLPF